MNPQRTRAQLLAIKQRQEEALNQALSLGLGNDPAMAPLLASLRTSISQLDEGISELDAAIKTNSVTHGLSEKLLSLLLVALRVLDWWLNHRP